VCDFGHVGDGGLHLNLVLPPGTDASDTLRIEVRGIVDDIVARHGGSYSAEHGLGPVNADRWLATTPPLERRLVAAIKAVVDPHRILGHPDHPYNRLPPLELH
jgi:FAD/FMN-containing dehydrogenase